jgi:aryl-alcohol dehydrogenase (NADP+)
MLHVNLGRTGLQVSRLCLGTMTFGIQCDEPTSFSILDAAAEAGITFLDTADVYPLGGRGQEAGLTEQIVGHWLKGRRDDVIVATKCFGAMSRRRWDRGGSRKHILDAVEGSLRRLGTDYIDLYQLHGDDPHTPLDETLAAFDHLVASGKVRYVGCSNHSAWRLARAIGRSEVRDLVRYDCVQPRYNLLFRAFERDLFPLCVEEGVGVIPYNPLAGGFLTGKHRPGDPTAGTRFTLGTAADRYQERYWHEQMFATVEELGRLAGEAAMTLAQLAVAWCLAQPAVTSPIIGASKPGQLADAVAAVDSPLDADLFDRLDELTRPYRLADVER